MTFFTINFLAFFITGIVEYSFGYWWGVRTERKYAMKGYTKTIYNIRSTINGSESFVSASDILNILGTRMKRRDLQILLEGIINKI